MTLPTDSTLLIGAGGGAPFYNVQKSLRFRASASAYLSRNMSAANTIKWTASFWFKPSVIDAYYSSFPSFFESVETTGAARQVGISGSNSGGSQLSIWKYAPSTYSCRKITSMVFRDPSAWYHAVIIWDTAQVTAEDRVKLYVNGTRVTSWSTNTNPAQNETWLWSLFTDNYIGAQNRNGSALAGTFYDGYLSEVNFVDGQALDASYFGATDPTTGVWMPKRYTGSYGTAGFYLPFTDTTSTTTLCYDKSGNGNNWTPNNISLTTGVTYDSMLDSPTPYADGGNGRGNYAVMNPLQTGSYVTQSNGNLTNTGNTATNSALVLASIGNLTSGKWYWEYTQGTVQSETCGICTQNMAGVSLINGENIGSYGIGARASGAVYGGTVANITSWTTGDIIGLAVDCDNGAIYWSKNGTWLNSGVPTSGASKTGAVGVWTPGPTKIITPAFGAYNSGFVSATFGQRPFSYTPPSGFVALNTLNLPAPTIANGARYMAATLYTGTGAAQTISNQTNSGNNPKQVPMQPDLIWIKARNVANSHCLTDSVRGVNYQLSSNLTAADVNNTQSVTAINTNGFTVGTSTYYDVNILNSTEVAWQWNAGSGSSSIPSGGTVTPTGASINTTSGFSVITFTRTAAGTDYVPHGLGVTPAMVIIKARSTTSDWNVWQQNMDAAPNNYYMILNGTAAKNASASWCIPSSTTVGVTNFANGVTAVMYCWAAVAGFSAFGSYTGNSSADGPMVYLGFRPRWVMIKCSSVGGTGWYIYDTTRNAYNVEDLYLRPEVADVETTFTTLDVLSNGFKIRTSNTQFNGANTYIYAAFAENPFKYALAR